MEDLFSSIPFGKWNLICISIMCLQQAASPALYYSDIFVDMPIDFRCSTNEFRFSNITFNNSSSAMPENTESIDYDTNESILSYDTNESRLSNITFDNSCSAMPENIENADYDESLHKCTTYEFDTSQVSSTFTSEFHLVCDKAWISFMFPVMLPIGSFFGTFFLGASDKWGRVTAIQISSTIQAVGSLILAFGNYDYIVILGRFLVGLCYPILTGSAITLIVETTSPKHRSTVSFIMLIPFYVFVMLLGVVAYYIREWRNLYLITSSPLYLIPIMALFLDKSPRWLVQKGRVHEAYEIMKKAAKMNNGTVDIDLTLIEREASIELSEYKFTSNYICNTILLGKQLIKQLYGATPMIKFTLVVPILWFLSSIVYFGVPLNVNSFTDNPYLYIIMVGASNFPVAFLGSLVIKLFGNIKTGTSLYLITGICWFGALLVNEDNIWSMKWIFAMLSVNCSGAILSICSLLISELFPTVLRSTGLGMSFAAHYAGFFLSCFINSCTIVSDTWWAFNTLCGISCVLAAILISFLPETHGETLCETTNEVKNREYNYHKLNV